MIRKQLRRLAALAVLSCGCGTALAQAPGANGADTAWLLTATALVLFMTLPGLALFYGGLVRGKNALSILMQCFAITGVVSVLWLAVRLRPRLRRRRWRRRRSSAGSTRLARAASRATAVSGTVPEVRVRDVPDDLRDHHAGADHRRALPSACASPRCCGSRRLWLLLVYVPVTHWVWGGGWLAKLGVMDFAGGIVVHVNAGVAALVCALVRRAAARLPAGVDAAAQPAADRGGRRHAVGGLVRFQRRQRARRQRLGRHGACSRRTWARPRARSRWMVLEWRQYGKPSTLGIVTGVVAGWARSRPRPGFVSPAGALLIGLVAGIVCFGATQLLKRRCSIDDSLDVSPVHGVGGMIGTLLTGVFAASALGGAGFTLPHGIGGAGWRCRRWASRRRPRWCALITWLLLPEAARCDAGSACP